MYRIQSTRDGVEVEVSESARRGFLRLHKIHEQGDVPLMTHVSDRLVLVVKTQKGTHKPYSPTPKDHDVCLRLVKKLPANCSNKDLHGVYQGLRRRGYRLLFRREGEEQWWVLTGELIRNRAKIGALQHLVVRYVHGEIEVVEPRQPELEAGLGRLVERARENRARQDEAAAEGGPPIPKKPPVDVLEDAHLEAAAQWFAQQIANHGLDRLDVEHMGYRLQAKRLPVDSDAGIALEDVAARVTALRIHARIRVLADEGHGETLAELVRGLLGARVGHGGRVFAKARKRFSRERRVAEAWLEADGYRRGPRHDTLQRVPGSTQRSLLVQWEAAP